LDSVLRAEVVDWSRVSPELMERWAEGINVATGLKHIGAWDGKARAGVTSRDASVSVTACDCVCMMTVAYAVHMCVMISAV